METGAAGLIAQIDYLADDRECLKAETVSHTFCSSTSLLPNIDPYVQELKNVACKLLQEQPNFSFLPASQPKCAMCALNRRGSFIVPGSLSTLLKLLFLYCAPSQ